MTDDYRKDSMPKKSDAAKIINAYAGGEPYLAGVQYTAFGRTPEVEEFNQTLNLTKEGAGTMKLYVGPYGVGKSFVMALFQSLAMKKGYVVMTTTIDPKSKYFAGSSQEKQGLALYRSLIENTAIKGQPKNALTTILDTWYSVLVDKTQDSGLGAVYEELDSETREYNSISAYGDVRAAIRTRFREISDDADYSRAMDYFLAKYTRKADVSNDIGAKDYITENNWFDVLNAMSHMFVAAGYKGLVVMVDQVDFLTTLPKLARQQNYDKILSMWNNINQGRTEYLSIILFGADAILNDRRGFQEDIPLYDRTRDSYVIKSLPQGELAGLLMKLKAIYEIVYGELDKKYDEKYVDDFIETMLNGNQMSGNCVRPIATKWIKHLGECLRSKEDVAIDESDIEDVQKEMAVTDKDILDKIRDE